MWVIRMYERNGFVHDAELLATAGAEYERNRLMGDRHFA